MQFPKLKVFFKYCQIIIANEFFRYLKAPRKLNSLFFFLPHSVFHRACIAVSIISENKQAQEEYLSNCLSLLCLRQQRNQGLSVSFCNFQKYQERERIS